MASDQRDHDRVVLTSDEVSGRDSAGSSLMPMLVGGLIMIVIGAIILMAFV